jgi:hypothetical protein
MEILLSKFGQNHKAGTKDTSQAVVELIHQRLDDGKHITFNVENATGTRGLIKAVGVYGQLVTKYGTEKVRELVKFKNCSEKILEKFDPKRVQKIEVAT